MIQWLNLDVALNKAKTFPKKQRSNVINALAYIYCYFLRVVEQTGWRREKSYIGQWLTAAGLL